MVNSVIKKSTGITKNNFSRVAGESSLVAGSDQGNNLNAKRLVAGVVGIICIIALAYLFFDFRHRKDKTSTILEPPVKSISLMIPGNNVPATNGGAELQVTNATDPVIAELVKIVFKHIFLPSGNVQVATVVNADEMRKVNPVFYQFAKAGDKVLIYSDRAILYDPVAEKVLDVAHVIQPTK